MSALRTSVNSIADEILSDSFAHAFDELSCCTARSIKLLIVVHVDDLDVSLIIQLLSCFHEELSHDIDHSVCVCSDHDRDLSCSRFQTGSLLCAETGGADYERFLMSDTGIQNFHTEFNSREVAYYISLIDD